MSASLIPSHPERLPNVHPGEVLRLDFLEPLGLSAYRLAKDIGVDQMRVSEILRGLRPVTLDTALRLSRYFGTTPQFWLNLQMAWDLEEIRLGDLSTYEKIVPFKERQSVAA